jgi:hypothetical protein
MVDMSNKQKIALTITGLLVLAWWFRYDTTCGGGYNIACVAYDRFTGKWIFPSELIEQKDN